jgi:Arc/MetJ family transcription regulator
MNAPQTQAQPPIASVGEAERVIANLETIMESLAATIGEETARVRGGQLREAGELEAVKTELARAYAAESTRLKNGKALVGRALPHALDALRRRHLAFQELLRINLTVLATAHAVSEGIIRGVSGELARKRAPQTYGASGRANGPSARASQPLALSRKL